MAPARLMLSALVVLMAAWSAASAADTLNTLAVLDHGELGDLENSMTQSGDDGPQPTLEQAKWAASDNWAAGIGIVPLGRVTLPVRLNLVLIGFDEYEDTFKSSEVLLPYFDQVETLLPHVYVNMRPDGSFDASSAQQSVVQYSYKVKVFKLSHTISTVFEAAINTFLRRDNATTSGSHYQIDVDRIMPLYESLLHAMGLSTTYSLVMVNPNKVIRSSLNYGYRSGFSSDELRQISHDEVLRKIVLQINTAEDKAKQQKTPGNFMPSHGEDKEALPLDESSRPLRDDSSFEFVVTTKADEWARDFLKQTRMLMVKEKPSSPMGPTSDDCTTPMTVFMKDEADDGEGGHEGHGHAINMKPAFSLAEAVEMITSVGASTDAALLKNIVSGGFAHPSCIVDSWVGHGRSAFIDLAAGPYSWGSLETSSIVNTATTYPNLRTVLTEAMQRYQWGSDEQQHAGRKSSSSQRKLLQMGAAAAKRDSVWNDDDDAFIQNLKESYADLDDLGGNSLFAELSIHENFVNKYCDPSNPPVSALGRRLATECADVKTKIMELAVLIKRGADAGAKAGRLDPTAFVVQEETDDSTGTVGDDDHVHNGAGGESAPVPPNPDVAEPDIASENDELAEIRGLLHSARGHYRSALEEFGSRLGNVVSRTFRTLVTPPTALPPDGVRQLAKRVSFSVYVVQNHHNQYRHLGATHGGFDFDAFKTQLTKLQPRGHQFSFTLQELTLADEPQLAMTYWNALHTAVVEYPTTTTSTQAVTRMYLDSEHLRQHLSKAEYVDGTLAKVNVFLFVVDYELPVLIDLWRQAAVVGNVVVGVQNAVTKHVTLDVCNGEQIKTSLRDPTKALIAATAQIVGGLLPAHVTAEPQGIVADYLWSVGNGPNAISSPSFGGRHNGFHVDIAHRHWLAVRLDGLAVRLNDIYARLLSVSTSVHAPKTAAQIKRLYDEALRTIAAISDHAAIMDYKSAFRLLDTVEGDIASLDQTTLLVGKVLHTSQCQQSHQEEQLAAVDQAQDRVVDITVNMLLLMVVNMLLVLILLWGASYARMPSKVKIN